MDQLIAKWPSIRKMSAAASFFQFLDGMNFPRGEIVQFLPREILTTALVLAMWPFCFQQKLQLRLFSSKRFPDFDSNSKLSVIFNIRLNMYNV